MAKSSRKTLKLKEVKENKKVKVPAKVVDTAESIANKFKSDLAKLKKSEIIDRAVVMLDTLAQKEISIETLNKVNTQQAETIGSQNKKLEVQKLKVKELEADRKAVVNTANEYLADKGLLQKEVKELKSTLASKENTLEQVTDDRNDKRSRVKHLEFANKKAKEALKKYEKENLWDFITRRYF